MTDKNIQRNSRVLSPEEKARLREVREQVEAEKDDIVSQAKEVFRQHEEAVARTIGELKSLREAQGLSLQDVAVRMGTDRANVHRLENSIGNPTVALLARYAEAIGKRFGHQYSKNVNQISGHIEETETHVRRIGIRLDNEPEGVKNRVTDAATAGSRLCGDQPYSVEKAAHCRQLEMTMRVDEARE